MGTFIDTKDEPKKCAIVVRTLPKPLSQVLAEAITMLAMLCVAAFAQQKGTFTDPRDGKKYKTIKIGAQTWMAENLNYEAEGSKCGENNHGGELKDENTVYCDKYGRLYDWATAMKACPEGWHLPSNEEWDKLVRYVLSNKSVCKLDYDDAIGKCLNASSGWERLKNGTDTYGFTALPGGLGSKVEGFVSHFGSNSYWWSTSEYELASYPYYSPSPEAYYYTTDCCSDYIKANYGGGKSKGIFINVRCVQGAVRKKNGERKWKYDNGELAFVTNYEDGVPHGEWKKFRKNGELVEVGNYKYGKLHGEQKKFYENGNLHSIENYKNDILHGEQKAFSESGNLRYTINYIDGKKHGEQKTFYESGNLASTVNYIDGEPHGEQKTFYENGNLQSVFNYIGGKLHGEYKKFNEDGKLIFTGDY